MLISRGPSTCRHSSLRETPAPNSRQGQGGCSITKVMCPKVLQAYALTRGPTGILLSLNTGRNKDGEEAAGSGRELVASRSLILQEAKTSVEE